MKSFCRHALIFLFFFSSPLAIPSLATFLHFGVELRKRIESPVFQTGKRTLITARMGCMDQARVLVPNASACCDFRWEEKVLRDMSKPHESGAKRKKKSEKRHTYPREALPASETTRLMVSLCSSRDGHTGSAGWTHCKEPPDGLRSE